MSDIITRDENGDLAVRTVTATEAESGSQYDDLYARTTDGKRALRVVGGGNTGNFLPLSGGELTGTINFKSTENFFSGIQYNGTNIMVFRPRTLALLPVGGGYNWIELTSSALYAHGVLALGTALSRWSNIYINKINNGADIAVPTTGGTLVVATPPTAEGTYVLKATVAADGALTTEWVAE